MLREVLQSHGSRLAAQFKEHTLSYSQLLERAEHKAGVLSFPNGLEMLERLLGCWLAGACAVPVAPSWPQEATIDPGAALMLRTSGSTRTPKRPLHSLAGLLRLAQTLVESLQLRNDERSLVCLQMYAPFTLTSQILPTLWAGGCLLIQPDFDPAAVARAVREQGVTRLYLYPAHYQALLEQNLDGQQLRSCVAGADLCPQALHQAFQARFGLHISQSMGMAETLVHSLNLDPRPDKKGSPGRPLGATRVSIRDPSGGTLSPGEIGEIHLESPWLMTGYLDAPAAPVPFPSGDLGFQDEDGYLWFLGRAGQHSDPHHWRELHELVHSWPEVAQAVILESTAMVALKPRTDPQPVSARLAQLGLQSRFLDQFPRLHSGKTDLLALRAMLG